MDVKLDFFTVRGENGLRVFEKRLLAIYGPKRNEVTREERKIHNGELRDLCSSPNRIIE
jgi:hypothetical protein